jgi:hypothetical protein
MNSKLSSLRLATRLCVGFFAIAAVPANLPATIIDFEDVAAGGYNNTSVISRGFRITHAGSFSVVAGNSGQGATDFSGNGTQRMISFNVSSLTLEDASGADFDIASFAGGESWINTTHYWATQIRAVGTLAAGGTVSQIFDLDIIKNPLTGMQLFTFDNQFAGLSRVEFSGIGGNPEFSVDNFVVNTGSSVPDSGSGICALVGMTFACLAMVRRFKADV